MSVASASADLWIVFAGFSGLNRTLETLKDMGLVRGPKRTLVQQESEAEDQGSYMDENTLSSLIVVTRSNMSTAGCPPVLTSLGISLLLSSS